MSEQVRLINDPILRKVCEPITFDLNVISVQGLLDLMYETMTTEGGIGLAANQIGHSDRIFILKTNDSYQEFINPEVSDMQELVEFEGEGCLSIPGAQATTKRFRRLTLSWLDKTGTKKQATFEDMQAFAIQHEMDHLNGKLYIDQFGPVKRDLILGKHRKYLRGQR
jgi:peptide deformylase